MKGISPLIAAVLLIAFTVAIATLIAGWFSTLTRTTTSAVSNSTAVAISCDGASLSIDQVYASGPGAGVSSTARAIIRNNGMGNYNIISAQLFNTTGNNFTTGTSLPFVLQRGNTTTLNFGVYLTSCPGSFSKVVVTTDCGGINAIFDSTPKCV